MNTETHFSNVIKAILEGRVVPFLGAGVNLCGRPAGAGWNPNGDLLPSGGELSEHLASSYGYPSEGDDKYDLVRVSQYIYVMNLEGPIYEELRKLLNSDYPVTPLHVFLAGLPAVLRARKTVAQHRYPLIVTTNYDDVMERALKAAGEEFDVVTYIAKGEDRGKFMHWPPGEEPQVIGQPNTYLKLSLDERTVVLKIHGSIDRFDEERDSYVITEDDYIDYLTRTDISNLLPVTLAAKLRRSHFLFLGYGLRDWNLRVILHRIWGQQKLKYKSWAIQLDPDEIDRKSWGNRDVEILNMRLEDYVAELDKRLQPQHSENRQD